MAVNTAVAAKVSERRVTLPPRLDGEPSPDGLELRIDGKRVRRPEAGIDLGNGGRAFPSSGGGLRFDLPDGATLLVTPGWWSAQHLWYLKMSVLGSRTEAGIMGLRAAGSCLPALSDGTSLGTRPTTAPDRYDVLYKKFAEAIDPRRAATLFGQNQRKAALANGTADVAVTGEPGFAKTYALSAEARRSPRWRSL